MNDLPRDSRTQIDLSIGGRLQRKFELQRGRVLQDIADGARFQRLLYEITTSGFVEFTISTASLPFVAPATTSTPGIPDNNALRSDLIRLWSSASTILIGFMIPMLRQMISNRIQASAADLQHARCFALRYRFESDPAQLPDMRGDAASQRREVVAAFERRNDAPPGMPVRNIHKLPRYPGIVVFH